MAKPRIGIIGLKGLPAFGGAARSMENILERLKDKYEFTIYAVDSHTKAANYNNGFKQIVFKSHKSSKLNIFFYYWKSLFHCLFRENFDLIHLHHAESGFITPFLKLKYKVAVTIHGIFKYYDDKFNKADNLFFRFSEKLNLVFSDIVISVSKPNVSYCKSKTNKRVIHIPNGININEDYYKDFNKSGYLLFAAGRSYSIKGCHIFIEALNKINYKGDVVIIGDLNQVPSYKSEIIKAAEYLNVEFIDLIKDKKMLMTYLHNAKLFVFPSLYEAMSIMLLEAVSMKTPAICSDIEANTAIFDVTETTFFKSGDPNDLALKLNNVLSNYTFAEKKAEKAYLKVSENYTWDKISSEYDELFRNIYQNNLN